MRRHLRPLQALDGEALRREMQTERVELEAQRVVRVELIKAGYRVLAAKCHPDAGGSHEAMARLNQVRDAMEREAAPPRRRTLRRKS